MKIVKVIIGGLATLCLVGQVYAATSHQSNATTPSVQTHSVKTSEKVDVNDADAKTIADAVIGIGVKRAEAIIAYRKQHGRFKSLEELAKIRGISSRFIKKNRVHLDEVLMVS